MADAVGEKNANLGEVRNRLGLRIPRGFAITTAAFDRFMVFNRLGDVVQKLKAKADVIETETILQVSEQIQMLIGESEVPQDLAQAILDAYDELDAATPADQGPLKISLRSSAIGEDSVAILCRPVPLGSERAAAKDTGRIQEHPGQPVHPAGHRLPSAHGDPLHARRPWPSPAWRWSPPGPAASCTPATRSTRWTTGCIINAVWGLGPYAVDGIVPAGQLLAEQATRSRCC